MEKVTLFFCDICGTFDSNNTLKTDEEELKRFADNLNKLILYSKTDKLIFSFVTTETLDTVNLMEGQLKTYTTNSNISIGKHIYCDGINDVNKPYDILAYIKRLQSVYDIDTIYYADDTTFFHLVLNELKIYFDIENEINSIIPKNNGLNDVNNIIENILNNLPNKRVLTPNK